MRTETDESTWLVAGPVAPVRMRVNDTSEDTINPVRKLLLADILVSIVSVSSNGLRAVGSGRWARARCSAVPS